MSHLFLLELSISLPGWSNLSQPKGHCEESPFEVSRYALVKQLLINQ
jgi:hypothetical protein